MTGRLMLSGSCLCGKIGYAIDGGPRFMYQCHCSRCRAATGAAFATNLIVDTDRFTITAGKDSLCRLESSPGKFRYFCAGCGSPIYSHGEKTSHVVSVRSGTLRQDPGLRVAYHAFVASKAPWVEINDGLPQFDEYPDAATVRKLMGSA
ncbi:MAG: GFA family protein [Burkholderiales bacterium]